MAARIAKQYQTPELAGAFTSASKLAAHLKVPIKDVQDYLDRNNVYQKFKGTVEKFSKRRIIAQHSFDLMEADLMFMKPYKDFKAICLVVDVFTKMAYARPVKNKNEHSVLAALKSVFIPLAKRKNAGFTKRKGAKTYKNVAKPPKNLRTDRNDFKSKLLKDFYSRAGINYYTSFSDTKCSVVERLIRTLRLKFARAMYFLNTKDWVTLLPKIIHSYNSTVHSATKMAPNQIRKQDEDKIKHMLFGGGGRYDKLKIGRPGQSKFKVNQNVRISIKKGVFEKEEIGTFTDQVYEIIEVDTKAHPTLFKLQDLADGEIIQGKFYQRELVRHYGKD